MKKMKIGLFAITFLLFGIVFSQEKKPGMISGFIKDARSKKPLIEAVVTISSEKIVGKKLALTDSTGLYSIKNLPAGYYTISFEMEGFRKYTKDSILLREGMSLGASFEMAHK